MLGWRVDGLFNVAADTSRAVLGRDTDILDIPVAVWRRTLDVNLTGFFYTCRHAVPVMVANGGGSIVNTLSGIAFRAEPQRPAYAVSKAGLIALTRHVAARWGKQGVRCNGLAPGLVMTESAAGGVSQAEKDAILAANSSTRLGRPEDIAAAAAFLLSDESEWINGQMHLVNGGR